MDVTTVKNEALIDENNQGGTVEYEVEYEVTKNELEKTRLCRKIEGKRRTERQKASYTYKLKAFVTKKQMINSRFIQMYDGDRMEWRPRIVDVSNRPDT